MRYDFMTTSPPPGASRERSAVTRPLVVARALRAFTDGFGSVLLALGLVVEHQQVPRPRQAFRDEVRVMLADDLANRPELLGCAEVRAEPPDNGAIATDNRKETGFTTADDDVVRCESRVALIEPTVRPDIGRRVDVQPIERASGGVDA